MEVRAPEVTALSQVANSSAATLALTVSRAAAVTSLEEAAVFMAAAAARNVVAEARL